MQRIDENDLMLQRCIRLHQRPRNRGPLKGVDGTWEACDQKQFGKRHLQDAKMEDIIDIIDIM